MQSFKFQIDDRIRWRFFSWRYGTVIEYEWWSLYNQFMVKVLSDSSETYTFYEEHLTLVETAIDKLDEIL